MGKTTNDDSIYSGYGFEIHEKQSTPYIASSIHLRRRQMKKNNVGRIKQHTVRNATQRLKQTTRVSILDSMERTELKSVVQQPPKVLEVCGSEQNIQKKKKHRAKSDKITPFEQKGCNIETVYYYYFSHFFSIPNIQSKM